MIVLCCLNAVLPSTVPVLRVRLVKSSYLAGVGPVRGRGRGPPACLWTKSDILENDHSRGQGDGESSGTGERRTGCLSHATTPRERAARVEKVFSDPPYRAGDLAVAAPYRVSAHNRARLRGGGCTTRNSDIRTRGCDPWNRCRVPSARRDLASTAASGTALDEAATLPAPGLADDDLAVVGRRCICARHGSRERRDGRACLSGKTDRGRRIGRSRPAAASGGRRSRCRAGRSRTGEPGPIGRIVAFPGGSGAHRIQHRGES